MNALFTRHTLALAAVLCCLSSLPANAEEVDPTVQALRNLDNSVASNQLEQAQSQLQALQKSIPADTRLEQAQREISAAYLRQAEAALKSGNLSAATQALDKSQAVMPVGNQQAAALRESIQQRKSQEEAAAQAARQAAEEKARAEAARAALARQQQAAERKAAEEQASRAAAEAAKPKAPVAQLIDPKAASSVIALPMLDSKDNDSLRNLLDKVAADVVAFRCKVKIEVRQNKDYPWVAALLSARVKKLEPSFNLQLEQQIDPASPPQLSLSPQS